MAGGQWASGQAIELDLPMHTALTVDYASRTRRSAHAGLSPPGSWGYGLAGQPGQLCPLLS